MWMHSDIDWTTEEVLNKKCVFELNILKGTWVIFGPGTEVKWYGTHTYKPKGLWDRFAEVMMLYLRDSGRPVLRATSALDRGLLKSKKGGKLSIHSTVTCRIVSHICVCQPAQCLPSTGKPAAKMNERTVGLSALMSKSRIIC